MEPQDHDQPIHNIPVNELIIILKLCGYDLEQILQLAI